MDRLSIHLTLGWLTITDLLLFFFAEMTNWHYVLKHEWFGYEIYIRWKYLGSFRFVPLYTRSQCIYFWFITLGQEKDDILYIPPTHPCSCDSYMTKTFPNTLGDNRRLWSAENEEFSHERSGFWSTCLFPVWKWVTLLWVWTKHAHTQYL